MEKAIKKGYLIADIKLEFDSNGNINNNYEINGIVKDVELNVLKKYNLQKLDFIFDYSRNNFLVKDIKIDFTFLHTVDKKNMLSRLKERKNLNRYDKFKFSFYNKVQNGFLKLSKKNKKKYLIVNSNLDIDFNKKQIISQIKKILR